MRVLLEKLFKKKVKAVPKFISAIKKITSLTNEIEKLSEELQEEQANFVLQYQNEFFLSLKDFLSIVDTIDNLSIEEILLLFKHVSEIKPESFSTVTLYAIPENNHIVLCEDIQRCEVHKGFKGKPVNIVTIKISK
jgi:predicted KAP-like P-loop ATPase